jgi:hypothetical protein
VEEALRVGHDEWSVVFVLRNSAAHLIEERPAEIRAQCQFRAIGQLHQIISVKQRMQAAHGCLTNQNGTVYSYELTGIQRLFQALDGLSGDVLAVGSVNYDVLVGRLNPENLFHRHKENAILLLDCQP